MAQRTAKGQFVKGVSGNPTGVSLTGELRIKQQIVGLRENMELAIRQGPLSVDRVCKVVNKMLDLAEKGDTKAAKLIFALAGMVGAGTDKDTESSTPRVTIIVENATFGRPQAEGTVTKSTKLIPNATDAQFEVVNGQGTCSSQPVSDESRGSVGA